MWFNNIYKRIGIVCISLFFSASVFGGEDFLWTFMNHVDKNRKQTVVVICSDSIDLNKSESYCEVSEMLFSHAEGTRQMFVNQKGRWQIGKKESGVKLGEQDQSFVSFILQFVQDREFQVNRTVFPLPISYPLMTGSASKKKLVMPRDWENVKLSQRSSKFYLLQSGRHANNRKIYVLQGGIKKEYYNFIYINKNWYLIEMELY